MTTAPHINVSNPPVAESKPKLNGKTVLIVDDDKLLVRLLSMRCRDMGLQVETAADGLRTLLAITKVKPDLLMLDLSLPDTDGFRVVERLADPKFPPLPVIMLTGRSDDASIQRCKDLGVFYVQKGPNAWQELESLIVKVFRDKAEEVSPSSKESPEVSAVSRVLLVDDDPLVLGLVASDLERFGLKVIRASNGIEGFWSALREHPAAVITDYDMQQGSGHYLLCRLKSTSATQDIPVIVYTGKALTVGQQASLQRDLRGRGNAAAFLTKPINATRLIDELRKHIKKFHASGSRSSGA